MARKKMQCDHCGIRTPLIYEHVFRVRRVTRGTDYDLVEQWVEDGFSLCPACHDKLVGIVVNMEEHGEEDMA